MLNTLTKYTEKARLSDDVVLNRFYDAKLAKKINSMKVGDILSDKGFVSTSTRDLGEKYGKELIQKTFPGGGRMKILAPKGSKVFATFRHSVRPQEREYTVARNSKLQFLGEKGGITYFKLVSAGQGGEG